MHRTSPVILLLEDSDSCAFGIITALLHSLPECRVLHARNAADAQLLSFSTPVTAFLVNLDLHDGDPFGFFADVQLNDPAATAIGLIPAERDDLDRIARDSGFVAVVRKPVDFQSLTRLLQRLLLPPAPASDAGAETDGGFEVMMRNLTPIDIIQMTCLRGSTCVLEFVSALGVGHVRIVDGEIIHAATGEMVGVDALNEIVGWKKGRVNEAGQPTVVVPTIRGNWQMLLMSAAHSIDQAQECAAG